MNMDVLRETDDTVTLHVEDTTTQYLNTIRRLLVHEVPVLAIEDVEFRQNSSILYDEIVAHRLGLVPLKTDYDVHEIGGDPVTLTLDEEATDEQITVYAEDLNPVNDDTEPVYPEMPIVKLEPGQAIECELTARMGRGEEHTKWSPCHAWYKHYPHITVESQPDNADELADKYPGLTLEDGELAVDDTAIIDHDVIDASIEDETDGAVTYEEADDYILYIENWGQVPTKDMLTKAIDIHNAQLNELQEQASSV